MFLLISERNKKNNGALSAHFVLPIKFEIFDFISSSCITNIEYCCRFDFDGADWAAVKSKLNSSLEIVFLENFLTLLLDKIVSRCPVISIFNWPNLASFPYLFLY